jgi:hypothetical protein
MHPRPAVFTPGDEPYLGRESVFIFDNLIVACLETSAKTAPRTHTMSKSDLQMAACQLIPQGMSIALSIRELVRQGHLFGALVLMRSLAERTAILLYLHAKPDAIDIWKRGWRHRERPSLAAMLTALAGHAVPGVGRGITQPYNSITHGDPDSGVWSLVQMSDGGLGHGVSKILDDPGMCDQVCMEATVWLSAIMGMLCAIFPEADEDQADTPANT